MDQMKNIIDSIEWEIKDDLGVNQDKIDSIKNNIYTGSFVVLEKALNNKGLTEDIFKPVALKLVFEQIYEPIVYSIISERLDVEISTIKNKRKISKVEEKYMNEMKKQCNKMLDSLFYYI